MFVNIKFWKSKTLDMLKHIWKRRALKNDEDPSDKISKVLDMRSISIETWNGILVKWYQYLLKAWSFFVEPRNREFKKPEKTKTNQLRNQGTKKPRKPISQTPRSHETKKPQKLKLQTKKPRNPFLFQVRESPALLNIPTPTPAPDHLLLDLR